MQKMHFLLTQNYRKPLEMHCLDAKHKFFPTVTVKTNYTCFKCKVYFQL